MARFKFFLIGSCDTPVLELPMADVGHLHDAISRARFIEGEMDMGDGTHSGVLIPISRVQLIQQCE